MTVNSALSSFAGFMVLLSLGLGHFTGQINLTHMSWSWLTAFVGLNLFQSGISGFCPVSHLFRAMGLKD